MSEKEMNETEYPVEEGEKELPTEKFPTEPDWIYPKDFDVKAEVENMEYTLLNKYHDLTHIYFERILKGAELNFLLNEIIILHYKIVKEFEKRNVIHLEPINSLDNIKISNLEYQYYVNSLNKESLETKKTEVNLSFLSPTRLK